MRKIEPNKKTFREKAIDIVTFPIRKKQCQKALLQIQEDYMPILEEKLGKYCNLSSKKSMVDVIDWVSSGIDVGWYDHETNRIYIVVGKAENLYQVIVHEYIHYISSEKKYEGMYIGVRKDSEVIGEGLNEALTEYISSLIVGENKDSMYWRAYEFGKKLADILGEENVIEHYFNHDIEYFITPFSLMSDLVDGHYMTRENILKDWCEALNGAHTSSKKYSEGCNAATRIRVSLSGMEAEIKKKSIQSESPQ